MKHKEKELIAGEVYYLDNVKEDWGVFKEYDDQGNLWFTPLEGSNYVVNQETNTIGFAEILDREWLLKED
jgi:hypothetical protein